MNFENSNNAQESQEKIPTTEVENLDAKKVEEAEISMESFEQLKRADANIAEIASLPEEEVVAKLENDPEKQSKVANLVSKAKGWAATIAGVAAMGASVAHYSNLGVDSILDQMGHLDTIAATSPAGIASALVVISTVFTVGSVFVKSYKDFSKGYEAKEAAKAAQKAGN